MQLTPDIYAKKTSASTDAPVQHSVCLVICYFGKAPAWMRFFFKSCAHNPDINFLIFTDCISADEAPANVSVIPCTLADIRSHASSTLQFDAVLDRPYKLCDYKAAYGAIFAPYLSSYSFWGMTDLDIVFGDIKAFITPEMLQTCDVINAHSDYLVGHFSLYRNEAPYNRLFEASRDYKTVYASSKVYSFAECNFAWTAFSRKQTHLAEAAVEIESMTHLVNRLADTDQLKKCFLPLVREKPQLHKQNWLLRWHNGKLSDMSLDEEIMYFHFHLFKKSPCFRIPDWPSIPDTFYINKHGFFA